MRNKQQAAYSRLVEINSRVFFKKERIQRVYISERVLILTLVFPLLFFLTNDSLSQITNDEIGVFRSKSSVDSSFAKQDKSIDPPQYYPLYEMLFASLGFGVLSGDTKETLRNGVDVQLFGIDYAPSRHIKGLRVGISPVDMSFHSFQLNPTEKKALEKYEIVTTENGVETKREPLREVNCISFRFSISSKLYPVNRGIYVPSLKSSIRPFLGIGFSYHLIDILTNVGEGVNKKVGHGFNSFYKFGVDITKDTQEKKSVFFRLEFIDGQVPDWNVHLLPELRAIRGGRYKLVRFGVGMTFFKK